MHRQYTIKRQKPLVAFYRCSHCDKHVMQLVTLNVSTVYNDKGTFTRSGVEKRAARADAMGAEAMDARLNALKSGRDTSVYAKAQLKCACPHCGRREPWAMMDVDWLEALAIIAVFVALFIYVMMKNTQYALIAAGVALGFFLMRLGWQFLMRCRIQARMLKCPPLFDDDVEKLQQRAKRIQGYADADYAGLLEGLFAQIAKK